MAMNQRQIEVFRAVMITGSISRAARLLHVSQPAVSRLIRYTEDKLRFALFERHGGRLHPTPEARKLFLEVDQLYLQIQRINELAHDLATRGEGRLKVLSSPSVGEWLVPAAIARFHREMPHVRIEFETHGVDELVHRISVAQADVALANLPTDHPNVLVTPLTDVHLALICRPDDALAALTAAAPADFADVPFISYGATTPVGRIVVDFLARAEAPARLVCQVRNAPAACNLVRAGVGVTIADELVARDASAGLVAVRLQPTVLLPLSLLSSTFEPLSKTARSFASCVREVLGSITCA